MKNQTPHTIKNFNALEHDAMIKRFAHGVMLLNASKPEVVQSHLSKIREKITTVKRSAKKSIPTKTLRAGYSPTVLRG